MPIGAYGGRADIMNHVLPAGQVFQAGTRADDDGNVLVDGGRVLCVCAAGADIAAAQKLAYTGAERIAWPGMQMRRDIGWRAIARR